MFKQFRIAFVMLLLLTIVTGVLYPLAVTLIAQTVFPERANGSLIRSESKIIGSQLIGQSFTSRNRFWGRLSSTSPVPYHANGSSGSNYGPSNPLLTQRVEERIQSLGVTPSSSNPVPVDLVTASGSGLDPDISPAAAAYQVPRIAAATGLSEQTLRDLIGKETRGRQLSMLGEPRVNVLLLNQALQRTLEETENVPHP